MNELAINVLECHQLFNRKTSKFVGLLVKS